MSTSIAAEQGQSCRLEKIYEATVERTISGDSLPAPIIASASEKFTARSMDDARAVYARIDRMNARGMAESNAELGWTVSDSEPTIICLGLTRKAIGAVQERELIASHAEQNGMNICDRCGGAGGFAHWPGRTCFDCGGSRVVEKSRRNSIEPDEFRGISR